MYENEVVRLQSCSRVLTRNEAYELTPFQCILVAVLPLPLYVSQRNNLENPPDLVISADTIVLLPADSIGDSAQILEKPGSKAKNLSMLEKQNGRKLKCITGVNIVYPSLHNPGYAIR